MAVMIGADEHDSGTVKGEITQAESLLNPTLLSHTSALSAINK